MILFSLCHFHQRAGHYEMPASKSELQISPAHLLRRRYLDKGANTERRKKFRAAEPFHQDSVGVSVFVL